MPTPKARRPKPDDFQALFDLMVGEACSQAEACRRLKLHAPSVSTAIMADPELRDRYDAVRQARGDAYGERVGDIVDQVIKGKLEPDRARVAIDGLKWTAGRMAPKRWGDKLALTDPDGEKLTINIRQFTPPPNGA